VAKWDATEGLLSQGDEVTVNGAMSGEGVKEGSFWGKVLEVQGDDADRRYLILDADGNETLWPRGVLRHRSVYRHAFIGVSGDRKHDSYSMRHFSEQEWKWLQDNNVWDDQKITAIATHSDNAAQVK
jgi:hypothetical protein